MYGPGGKLGKSASQRPLILFGIGICGQHEGMEGRGMVHLPQMAEFVYAKLIQEMR